MARKLKHHYFENKHRKLRHFGYFSITLWNRILLRRVESFWVQHYYTNGTIFCIKGEASRKKKSINSSIVIPRRMGLGFSHERSFTCLEGTVWSTQSPKALAFSVSSLLYYSHPVHGWLCSSSPFALASFSAKSRGCFLKLLQWCISKPREAREPTKRERQKTCDNEHCCIQA